jgi:hypothetical protein
VATFDSAWCLAEFDRLAGRPDADEITDATKYARLAQAQLEVIHDIAAIAPTSLYRTGGPTATTTSGGVVHTFGTDGNGHAVAPLGYVWIGRSTATYPDADLLEGVDYLNEGTQIRMVNERVESSLYWNGIPTPADIASGTEPSLRPAPARILIVLKAVKNFAEEGNQNPGLADTMANRYAQEFARWMLVLRTQYRNGGGLVVTSKERAIVGSGGVI